MRALELGAEGIELDVHATRDGVVVVHHDAVPHGVSDEELLVGRPIAELSLRELGRIPSSPDSRIPTLATVLRSVGTDCEIFVEIKGRGIERAVVETIRAARAKCAVHSFDHHAVRRVGELAPGLRTGILLSSALVEPVAALEAAAAKDYWIWRDFADASLVEAVHEAGGRVIVWTVNDLREMRALCAIGVDGICTDAIADARAVLAEEAA
ncbi:MAG: glycerophosphodiester phosphodiesterase [Gemmatimonadota bacterium]|nr:glycerophosphodiester phosphodiesterase [Gemmatimonadota bacterium]